MASFQNVARDELERLVRSFIESENLKPVPGKTEIELHLNPAGDWSQGGFEADTGRHNRTNISWRSPIHTHILRIKHRHLRLTIISMFSKNIFVTDAV